MKSLFSIGKKAKQILTAEKFHFTVYFHSLQPWVSSSGQRSIAIGWQRGQDKKGATRSVYPAKVGRSGYQVRFNDKIEITASLYKSNNGTPNPSNMGSFEKKCLVLAVLETDGRTDGTFALGRVVIDLAEFAAIEHQETRAFQVTCSNHIRQSIGTPNLLVTIRTNWKKVHGAPPDDIQGAQNDIPDDTSSISANTTGSRMTNNLNSLIRHKFSEKWGPGGQNDEQDLQGFEVPAQKANSAPGPKDSQAGSMLTIKEDQDDEAEHVPLRGSSGAASRQTSKAASSELTPGPKQMGQSVEASPTPQAETRGPSLFPSTPVAQPSAVGLEQELLCAATNEVCVLTAPANTVKSKRGGKARHSAARRLARTLISMTAPDQSVGFGLHMLHLIESQLECAEGELNTLAFWWSNLVQLRVLLTHPMMNGKQLDGERASRILAVGSALMPRLRAIERGVFDRVLDELWAVALEPAVKSRTTDKVASSEDGRSGAATKRAHQEAALSKWFEGLDRASGLLKRLGEQHEGAARVQLQHLRHQVLLQCLRRLDALMFYHLLVPSGSSNQGRESILDEYDPDGALWGGSDQAVPIVGDSSLPFVRGLLSFGAGMSVKMTATRLHQWAVNDGGLISAGAQPGEKNEEDSDSESEAEPQKAPAAAPPMFPLMRATSDLLMMPKELLLEAPIRADIQQTLTLQSILDVLTRFQTDEYAADPIASHIIEDLQRVLEVQTETKSERPPRRSEFNLDACTPAVTEALVTKMHAGQEPGLEYSAESEDELMGPEGIASTAAGIAGSARFKILHHLWISGARNEAVAAAE